MNEMKQTVIDYARSTADEIEKAYEAGTLGEWIEEEVLDINYTLDCHRRLIGVTLWVTIGGPTVWIDTQLGRVSCAWGTEKGDWFLSGTVSENITDYFDGMF